MVSQLIPMIGGAPIEVLSEGPLRGEVPAITYEKKDACIHWHGAKFPKKLFYQTVAFAKYCYDKYGGEVQGRLYYNKEFDAWAVVVLPQYVSRTLESEEIEDHEDRDLFLRHVGSGWTQNGTWHSHAGAKAFQSTTDASDEEDQAGLHYTIGDMGKPECSFHSRYTVRKVFYDIDDEEIMGTTEATISECTKFPKQWIAALHDMPKKTRVMQYGGMHNFGNMDENEYWEQWGNGGSNFGFNSHDDWPQRRLHSTSEYRWFKGYRFLTKDWLEFIKTPYYTEASKASCLPNKVRQLADLFLGELRSAEISTEVDAVDTGIGVINKDLAKAYNAKDDMVDALEVIAMHITGCATLDESIVSLNEWFEAEFQRRAEADLDDVY